MRQERIQTERRFFACWRWPLVALFLFIFLRLLDLSPLLAGVSKIPTVSLADNLEAVRRSIYKIRVVSQASDFKRPWAYKTPVTSTGTGFYIGNRQILTNAHVVANGRFITVQRDGDAKLIPAYVTYIAHDCDLAILTVREEQYFTTVKALEFGQLPRLRSPVSTVGFPTGGEQISVTKGVVSRVAYRRYVHNSKNYHLLVQVDSAINAGNSGGPVMQGTEVVGVAFQSFTAAENTGYMIPTPVIERFITDIKDGKYDGHPDEGILVRKWAVTNPATAAFHNLRSEELGVKVSYVAPWAALFGKLQEGDILLAVEGHPIGVDGRITFFGERLSFHIVFDLKQIGDSITYKVAREGRVQDIKLTITKSRRHPYTGLRFAKRPRFIVFAGLVFTELNRSFLHSYGNLWYKKAPLLLKYLFYHSAFDPQFAQNEDFVVISEKLPHKVNAYVGDVVGSVVAEVNGEKIKSFAQFVEALRASKAEYIQIGLASNNNPIILPLAKVKEANAQIQETYNVYPDRWLTSDEDGVVMFKKG